MISNLCFFRFPKRWASWPLAWESPVQSVQYFWLFYLSSTFLQISKGVQHEEEGYSVGSLLCPWWSRYYRSSYSSSPELAMFATSSNKCMYNGNNLKNKKWISRVLNNGTLNKTKKPADICRLCWCTLSILPCWFKEEKKVSFTKSSRFTPHFLYANRLVVSLESASVISRSPSIHNEERI